MPAWIGLSGVALPACHHTGRLMRDHPRAAPQHRL